MATTKDYYDILGVPKDASQEDIKKAYRKLAREHHPDMVSDGDKNSAESRFKEINEAYQVLKDPQQRKSYDQFGHAGPGFAGGAAGQGPFGGFGQQGQGQGQWGPFTYTYSSTGPGGGQQGYGDFDPFDIFEEVFGFRGFGGNARRPRKGKNLYYEMIIDFAEAVNGVEKEVKVESGKVKIKIPQGARDGTELRFPGKGMPGPEKLPSGDLFITLRVKTPKEFRRAGDHLGVSVEISFIDAALGGTVKVPVVDTDAKTGVGTAKLKIPAGTQAGAQFRLKGKGMPMLGRSGRGDVIVQVFISIPEKLTRKQQELLEELKKEF